MNAETKAAPRFFYAVCPKCGGDVVEANVVPGWSPITVEVKGDGTREAECTGETDMCWDGIRPEDEAKPYGCRSCVTFFTLDEVTLEPEGVA